MAKMYSLKRLNNNHQEFVQELAFDDTLGIITPVKPISQ